MSENPSQFPIKDEPEFSGGWHSPRTKEGGWRKPEAETQEKSSGVWKVVSALPEDMAQTPETKGGWHLPSPEDTTFSPEDKIEMSPLPSAAPLPDLISPEDMLLASFRQQPRPTPTTASVTIPAPEDLVVDDEIPTVAAGSVQTGEHTSITELLALASLVEEEPGVPMSDLAALADAVEEEMDEEIEALSDDQRALFEAATGAAEPITTTPGALSSQEESAAEYARRMAQQFGGDEAPAAATPSFTSPQPAPAAQGESAADYARRMAQQFGGDLESTGPSVDTGAYDPQEAELTRKFQYTEEQVRALKRMHQSGQITEDALQAQLRQLMVLDERTNVWWMMGFESDNWYKFENNEWIVAVPPVAKPQAPRTLTSDLEPVDVLAGSLPILPEAPAQPAQTGYEGTMGYQQPQPGSPIDLEYSTPLPRQVERVDPNLTMVGESAFANTQPMGSEPTFANFGTISPASQPTVAGASFVERTPYEEAPQAVAAPDYDLAESPTYRQYSEQRRSSTARLLVTAAVFLIACGLLTGIAAVLGGLAWYNNAISPWQEQIAALASYEPIFNTARILDAQGNLIAELNSRSGGARTPVNLDQVSPFLIHAVISQENERFFDDPGFDPLAIGRALLQNLSSGTIESGASTITQQIAKNLVIQDSQVTADRKITEVLVANEIARQYDKNFILQLYLNEVFFANQSYGIQEAARFYFNKNANELNMAESALLASIIPAPSDNDPVVNKDRAIRNMRDTLNKMIQVGCLQYQHGNWPQQGPFCIQPNVQVQYEGATGPLYSLNPDGTFGGVLALQFAEVELNPYKPRAVTVRYPHFVNLVQGQVEQMFGTDAMFQRGFTIQTTLIPRIQDAAQAALTQQVAALVNNGVNTGSVMVTDPRTGAIRALVGSPDFANEAIAGQVDTSRTFQQPGSAIKGVLYTAALEGVEGRYLTPASILWDVPSPYNINGVPYNPVNFDRTFRGPVSVRYALQNSLNVPAVKAYEFIGSAKFAETAQRMGLRFVDNPVFGLPSALGANEVRLFDMMKAYGTLANNGRFTPLFAIEKITENINGQNVEVPMPPSAEEARQAVSPQIAYLMQNILSDDAARADEFGTNTTLTLVRRNIASANTVAAKTGTSDEGRDLWTMGFTSNTVVGVWLGTFDNARTFNTTGFLAASPIWNVVMDTATASPPPQFQNPGGVVLVDVCRDTGTQIGPNDNCANRTRELVVQDRLPPPATESFVRTIEIDTWTGLIANEWCPENKQINTFANIPDQFAVNWLNTTAEGRLWAERIGLPLPLEAAPTTACAQGNTLPSVRLNNPSENQTIAGTLTITGQVTAPDFNRYQLEYASVAQPENFIPIGGFSTTQQPNAGSTLGNWDTTTVLNGTYIVRLTATSNSGGFVQRTARVNVVNNAPPVQPTIEVAPTLSIDVGGFTPAPFDQPTPTATINPGG